jgi:hypothetical protein
MSRGKYLSLPGARKKRQLDRFAKEHLSEGDADPTGVAPHLLCCR